ncbi:MAG TPA: 5'-3' exonuclease [Polyangiaceae bacterium]|nr:5'-3' exonuclease [Polyangiaceae bacterium]
MHIHLVDGTYELFRNYFAVPSTKAPSGREVGAARGLLRSLLAWLRAGGVTHIAVAFDHVVESFRNDLYAGYKTGEGMDPDLYSQFELAERVTRALGIVTWPMVEFEADDALATFADRAHRDPSVERVWLCTIDKDLAQCVRGERVVCFDRHRNQVLDASGVRSKFGVDPGSIPDYLALVGDSADGYPGLPGFGAKSAAALLTRWHTIDRIPDSAESFDVPLRGAKKLAETLARQRSDAQLFRTLATLRCDVPLPEGIADLEWQGAKRAELEALCEEIGDTTSLERVPRFQPS